MVQIWSRYPPESWGHETRVVHRVVTPPKHVVLDEHDGTISDEVF